MVDNKFLLSNPPFADYLADCRRLVETRRTDLQRANVDPQWIIDANSPYEFKPASTKRYTHGVLLIHGLLDCPFTLREVGERLSAQGVLCRSILLPGHGTRPEDLLTVTYQDWLQAVQYGVQSLKQEADQISMIGYSTGAALAAYHAACDPEIHKIAMLAPAVKIHPLILNVLGLSYLPAWVHENRKWVYNQPEIDYVKYTSIVLNAPRQVDLLSIELEKIYTHTRPNYSLWMAVSQQDEVISSWHAIEFFKNHVHPNSKLLLYTSSPYSTEDKRIEVRSSKYPALNINHFSHISIPFAPTNMHYGQHGDFSRASHIDEKDICFGAYNDLESAFFNTLNNIHVAKYRRRELTYNPDFEYTSQQLVNFITA